MPVPDTRNPVRTQKIMLGLICRLGAMAALGVMFALVKLVSQSGVHFTESVFWRQLMGLPVVLLWLWSTGDIASIRTRRPVQHGLRMLLGLSAMSLNFAAITMLPMAEATTIGFTAPVFATALAALLLSEATGRYRWGAVLLGFIGVAVAIQPDDSVLSADGIAVAVTGALMTGAVVIQMRRMTDTESAGAIVFWFSLTSLIPLGIAMIFYAKAHDQTTWALIAILSLMGALAQILLTTALRHAPVAAVITMDYSALLWSVLFGWLIFNDIPGPSIWLGAPLVIAAGIIIAWREHHQEQQRKILQTTHPGD